MYQEIPPSEMGSYYEGFLKQKMGQVEKSLSEDTKGGSPKRLRSFSEAVVKMFVNEFKVDGLENLREYKEKNPDKKFVIAASHLCNLDAPAAVSALGNDFNIQITGESILFELIPHRLMMKMAGKESFSPLQYKKSPTGKHGIFNPDNFTDLKEKMGTGKTPWIAVHPFTTKEEMKPAKKGAVYLSQLSDAVVIPVALEYTGGPMSLEGGGPLAKGIMSKIKGEGKATFRIGKPMELRKIEGVELLNKPITELADAEKEQRTKILQEINTQANEIAEQIAKMLPEENRGEYK